MNTVTPIDFDRPEVQAQAEEIRASMTPGRAAKILKDADVEALRPYLAGVAIQFETRHGPPPPKPPVKRDPTGRPMGADGNEIVPGVAYMDDGKGGWTPALPQPVHVDDLDDIAREEWKAGKKELASAQKDAAEAQAVFTAVQAAYNQTPRLATEDELKIAMREHGAASMRLSTAEKYEGRVVEGQRKRDAEAERRADLAMRRSAIEWYVADPVEAAHVSAAEAARKAKADAAAEAAKESKMKALLGAFRKKHPVKVG